MAEEPGIPSVKDLASSGESNVPNELKSCPIFVCPSHILVSVVRGLVKGGNFSGMVPGCQTALHQARYHVCRYT